MCVCEKWLVIFVISKIFLLSNAPNAPKRSAIADDRPLFAMLGGVEHPTKFSKKGVLDRTSIFRGGCLERGGWSFLGAGCNFHIKNKNFSHAKNKLKSENLMIKKVYIQKCFSLFFFSLCFCFYNSVTFKR